MTLPPRAPRSTPSAVTMLALDVDGVLTDGSIWLDDEGQEHKRFNVRDGFALVVWRTLGFRAAVVTGRSGRAVDHRARELGISLVLQGVSDKAAALATLCDRAGVVPAQIAFLGDDWPDAPILRRVGYPMAVADAEPLILSLAAFVTTRPGGRGAVRDAVEHLLSAHGLMDRARAMYDLSP